ncbi:MAG: electron transfer flavoprotein subunit beta/FixA family protein [Deltaproteobacteria bacterium]|jgi:electron transfer flavoprotein beta subunit|nr:electron transfer flavoprotein subunit beta/FixA family protein [Deltaproteobacteria bacterium]
MNIAVCIKQVPDGPTIRIDRQSMTIVREGTKSIINPLDYVALEAALYLKNRKGGEVTVMTMGPPQSEEALREALAVGADGAILLTDPAFAGADTLATSHVLARAISTLEPFPDLILCGMQTIDSDTGHVGPQIAEELDLPQVCGVNEIHVEEGFLMVKRLSDNFLDTFRVTLPALLTVNQRLFPIRHLPLGALEIAFSQKDIIKWGIKELNLKAEEVGIKGSATQVRQLHSPPQKREGKLITGSPQVLVDNLIRKLEALSILDEEHENG